MINSIENQIPIEMQEGEQNPSSKDAAYHEKVRSYVLGWKNRLKSERLDKLNIWNECWALYRGEEDFSNKEDWQTKIVLPKSFSTIKSAVNVIKRFLHVSSTPWNIEDTSDDDAVGILRANRMTSLTKVFTEKAHLIEEFCVGLETSFIMGLGVLKCSWNLVPRTRMRVETRYEQPAPLEGAVGNTPFRQPPWDTQSPQPVGQLVSELTSQQNLQYPNQLPGEATLGIGGLSAPYGAPSPIPIPIKETIREEVIEGRLSINAVDPYNFYWLPGSKLNKWVGTIEIITLPKWQLMSLAKQGVFDVEQVKNLHAGPRDETHEQNSLRFGEHQRNTGSVTDATSNIVLVEYYGPLIIDDELVDPYAHVIIANDSEVLLCHSNPFWDREPPYVGFSPLQLPFRTEGVGLIEMVRSIDKALNQIVNLGVDTLVYRLMPLFEFTPDVYENPEDLKTGLTPGKIMRRNTLNTGNEMGLRPIEFQDVSPGAAQMAGILDRAHQEGGLVSELQQSLPRWSGAQTATETEAIQANQNSFFGSLAADIEKSALAPLIEMSLSRIMQFIDTANDPRVADILGVGYPVLAGMGQSEIMEMIQGDYMIRVQGLSGQLEKAQALQSLIQFMNLIGQNPEAFLPYIKQDVLLRKILESFRPAIDNIDDMMADPQTVAATKAAMAQQRQEQALLGMIPQLAQMAQDTRKAEVEQAQVEADAEGAIADRAIALKAASERPASKEIK